MFVIYLDTKRIPPTMFVITFTRWRTALYKLKRSLPPCSNSLKLHYSKANWQIYTWRNFLEKHLQIPSPDGYGWEQDGNGVFNIKWNLVQPAHDEILEMLFCRWSKKRVVGSCICIGHLLICYDACHEQDW